MTLATRSSRSAHPAGPPGGRTARGAFFAAALAAAALAVAPTFAVAADPAPSGVETIKPGLYRLNGAGGGSILLVGAKGMVVVDSQRAGGYGALMSQIRRVADNPALPVRALMLTAVGPDQAGNVAQFAQAGVPVLVQRRAVARLSAELGAAAAAVAPRLVVFDTDYMLYSDELQALIEHVGSGRTGADAIVQFPELRVLAVGDLYTADTPVPDCASGGSYLGWASALAHAASLTFDVAVPSRGKPVGKPEMWELINKLKDLAARAGPRTPEGPAECRQAPK